MRHDAAVMRVCSASAKMQAGRSAKKAVLQAQTPVLPMVGLGIAKSWVHAPKGSPQRVQSRVRIAASQSVAKTRGCSASRSLQDGQLARPYATQAWTSQTQIKIHGIARSWVLRRQVLARGLPSSVLVIRKVASKRNAVVFQASNVTKKTSTMESAKIRAPMDGAVKQEGLGRHSRHCSLGRCLRRLLHGLLRNAPRNKRIAVRHHVVQTEVTSASKRTVPMESAKAHAAPVLICTTQMERIGLVRSWVHKLQVGPQNHGKRGGVCPHGLTVLAGRSSLQIAVSQNVARKWGISATRRTKIGLHAVLVASQGTDLAILVEIGVAKSWGLARVNLGENLQFSASLWSSPHPITRQG